MRVIRESLVGKEGPERVRILKAHLAGLPGYMSGPYGKIRLWLSEEIERSRSRARAKHRDAFTIPKEGDRQVVLTGAPNAGKSALLRALSGRQLKVADYPFATLKPTAGLVWLDGAAIQFVEVPGIIEGAAAGRGIGRSLLGAVRHADFLLLVASLREPVSALEEVLTEISIAGIDRPAVLCLTGIDLPGAADRAPEFTAAYPDLAARHVLVSSETGLGLDELRRMVWALTGLIRVWPAKVGGAALEANGAGAVSSERPFVVEHGATVRDLAARIHKHMAARLRGARVWGPSARFAGQQVGASHELRDGDRVELLMER
jgi:small GTP-binding protein